IVPHFLVGGVENMRAVAVHVDALDFLGVDIARDVAALVDHQAALARRRGLMGKYSAEQPGAYDQIVVHTGPSCVECFLCGRRRPVRSAQADNSSKVSSVTVSAPRQSAGGVNVTCTVPLYPAGTVTRRQFCSFFSSGSRSPEIGRASCRERV